MTRLYNPYADREGYHCFGCSPANRMGLRMEFFEENGRIRSIWLPEDQFQGFHDVLHGGIQATLMDEIASWVVFVKLDTAGVTYRLNVRYRKPVRMSQGRLVLTAALAGRKRNLASIEVELHDSNGQLCADGIVDYYVLPREKAIRELHFPGRDAFYPERS